MGIKKQGFHGFRRFRVTHLRKRRVPENLLRFWIGHSNKSVTDRYDQVHGDLEFRRFTAASVGLGFELPIAKTAAYDGFCTLKADFVPYTQENATSFKTA